MADLTEDQKPWKLRLTAGSDGRSTDLEAAVREAISSLPSGMLPRLALISDGKENKGSIARAAWQARQAGIPIDTYAMQGRERPALRLESVSLPMNAFTGSSSRLTSRCRRPERRRPKWSCRRKGGHSARRR